MEGPRNRTVYAKQPFRELLASISYNLGIAWSVHKLIIPIQFMNQLMQVTTPFIAIFLPKLVIDALTAEERDAHTLLSTLLIIGLCLLVVNILGSLTRHFADENAFMVRQDGWRQIMLRTMSMDYQTLESPRGQEMLQRALLAVNNQNTGMQTVPVDLAALVAHLSALGLYVMITSQLSPFIVLALAVASLINYMALRFAQRYEASRRGEYADIGKKLLYMRETALDYRGGKDLRLYKMTNWFEKLYQGYIDEQLKLTISFFKRYFASDSLVTVLDTVRDAAACLYLISLVLRQEIGLGDFTLYFGAIAGISHWLTLIFTDIANLQRGCNEIADLRAFVNEIGRVVSNPIKIEPNAIVMPQITFENITFRYPGADADIFRNFNLTIHSGEKLALVGVNGAGKTTLVKLLCGLYQPNEGRILLDGVDISRYPNEDLYRLFGVVLQDVNTFSLSLAQNVATKPVAEIDKEKLLKCLDLAGLGSRVEEFPKGIETQLTRSRFSDGIELSGGQSQKMLLARALYKDAPIVVMDEPTAALDPIAEAEMYERYDQMVGNKTSLYISHRLASTRFCDRIAFIESGTLLELGSHTELMALGGRYAEMYAVQSQYYQESFEGR